MYIDITPEHIVQIKKVILSISILISTIYILSSIANSTLIYNKWGPFSKEFVRGIAIILTALGLSFSIAIHLGLFE